MLKVSKVNDKERILKAAKGGWGVETVTYKGRPSAVIGFLGSDPTGQEGVD